MNVDKYFAAPPASNQRHRIAALASDRVRAACGCEICRAAELELRPNSKPAPVIRTRVARDFSPDEIAAIRTRYVAGEPVTTIAPDFLTRAHVIHELAGSGRWVRTGNAGQRMTNLELEILSRLRKFIPAESVAAELGLDPADVRAIENRGLLSGELLARSSK